MNAPTCVVCRWTDVNLKLVCAECLSRSVQPDFHGLARVRAAIQDYVEEVRETWAGYWRDKTGHRYANDFAAFLGERVLTDYVARPPAAHPAPSTGGEDVEFMADAYKAMAGERAAVSAVDELLLGELTRIIDATSHPEDYRHGMQCLAELRGRLATPDRAPGLREAAVTRFEVIDRRILGKGRAFVAHDIAVELSYQDDGRTLKVFVTDRATSRSTRQ